MDFDPSEFLSVAISEDQDAVYTAPDLPQSYHAISNPPDTITVEGGLQMENDVQIPVPVFGTLDLHNQEEVVENGYDIEPGLRNELTPIETMDTTTSGALEPDNIAAQPSPVERTNSPHMKKIIPTSLDETRFRKDIFAGHYERVKLFRLHCTICDIHLGCAPWLTERQMRMHKLLNVITCRKCFEFYGDINFPTQEDAEIYCCWCGEGGEVFCCSNCPKVVCKKCIERNFGPPKIKEIEENDSWECFVCKPKDIWPHRALLWGLQRFSREMRQHVALLAKNEKQAKLSKDTSHCCLNIGESFQPVSLPFRHIMSKIPICMIAITHQASVLNQQQQPVQVHQAPRFPSTSVTLNNNVTKHPMQSFLQPTRPPMTTSGIRQPVGPLLQTRLLQPARSQQMYRGVMNRPAPPVMRQMPPTLSLPYTQSPQLYRDIGPSGLPRVYRAQPKTHSLVSGEVIDLVENPSFKQDSSNFQVLSHDISWLEKGVNDVEDSLSPVKRMIDRFDSHNNEFKTDFDKLISFTDRLSYNIKIAICNLAKINQDLLDAKKVAVDKRLTSNVNENKLNGIAGVTSKKESSLSDVPKINMSQNRASLCIKTHQKASENVNPQELDTTSTPEEDIGDVTPALLCEAVLEVEGNKENENDNKREMTPIKKSKTKKQSKLLKNNVQKSLLNNKNSQLKIQVIDLIDDEETEGFDSSFYCKKFNIKPCRVIIRRCKI